MKKQKLKKIKSRVETEEKRRMRTLFRRIFGLLIGALTIMGIAYACIMAILEGGSIKETGIVEPRTGLIVIAVLLSLLLITQIITALWMKRITRPAEHISSVVSKVAQGEFQERVDTTGFKEEMLFLGEDINTMIEELNSIEVMRSDFVSNVSHEFRAPLSAISGYVTLLSDPKITEEQQNQYFDYLKEATRELSSLVDNVLKLSRLQSQNIISQPQNFYLDEQLRRAVLMFERQWSEKNLELELELPECEYFGSEELLSQVWVNLIGNAVKFTPQDGKISVSIDDTQEDIISVKVEDSGEGMTEETKRHIFEKFYQGDSSRKSQGNGLGLALVKTICNLTDAQIQVESEPGKGSCFTVSLPR